MNKDNFVNELAQTKIWADSEKYFSLFDRHVPSLGKGRTVLLYSIDNVDCILKIVAKNPDASYIVYGNPLVNRMIEGLLPTASLIDETSENRKAYNIDMNFDCIIMNPPYDKNLHLKILAEAIKHLKDDESMVVNLSPVRWLQDPLAKYKKNSDYNKFDKQVYQYIQDIEVFDENLSRQLFNNGLNTSVGIYTCKHILNSNNITLIHPLVQRLIDTVVSMPKPSLDLDAKDGWRVRIQTVLGGSHSCNSRQDIVNALNKFQYFYDGLKNNKPWYEFYQKTGNTKTTLNITTSIKFNSEIECINYTKSLKCNSCQFIIINGMTNTTVNFNSWPWMGDCVNPRTGLKGYQSEWTDEDFYKFFGITDDEKKIIEETMAKYAKK